MEYQLELDILTEEIRDLITQALEENWEELDLSDMVHSESPTQSFTRIDRQPNQPHIPLSPR
jgi:hypothetical protein